MSFRKHIRAYGDKIIKVTAQIKIQLARDLKSNKKHSISTVDMKGKPDVGPFMKREGKLIMCAVEVTKLFNIFFTPLRIYAK